MKKIGSLLLCGMLLLASCENAMPREESSESVSREEVSVSVSEESIEESLPDLSEKSEAPAEPEIPAELLLEVPVYVEEVQPLYHEEYTAVLGSAEEAKAFFDRYAPAGNGDDYRWQARYDEDFFEEHLLAVAYLPEGSGTPWTGSESLWLKEGVLEWNANSYVYGDGLEWDLAGWVMAAELPRDLPVTVKTSIEIHYRGVTLYQVNTARQGEAEILLLTSREEAEPLSFRGLGKMGYFGVHGF
mgnify:CR=1 FL=1